MLKNIIFICNECEHEFTLLKEVDPNLDLEDNEFDMHCPECGSTCYIDGEDITDKYDE